MNDEYDEHLLPEASRLVAHTVLTELLARLARMSPQFQAVTAQSLEAATAGLKIVGREQDDAFQQRVFARAASMVEDMHLAALGAIDKEKERARH